MTFPTPFIAPEPAAGGVSVRHSPRIFWGALAAFTLVLILPPVLDGEWSLE